MDSNRIVLALICNFEKYLSICHDHLFKLEFFAGNIPDYNLFNYLNLKDFGQNGKTQ